MRQAGSPYFFTFHRRQGHYGTERRMAPWPASKLLPPMSTVGAGVKPSALGGRASRQVGDAMPPPPLLLLLLPAYGAPARWECADIRDMRGGI